VATRGNLADRMLGFAYKCFDCRVPELGELDDEDQSLFKKAEGGFETVGNLYNACKFRAVLGKVLALALAREASGYALTTLSAGLDRKAP
jgi:methionyl-tRNA synthetase